jgi:hypothetical protein
MKTYIGLNMGNFPTIVDILKGWGTSFSDKTVPLGVVSKLGTCPIDMARTFGIPGIPLLSDERIP